MAERNEHDELLDALNAIDPARLGSDEWTSVFFGAHDGLTEDEIDEWNRRDPARYDERKNRMRGPTIDPGKPGGKTRATVFYYAKRFGWTGCRKPGTTDTARAATPTQKPRRPWALDLTGEEPAGFRPTDYEDGAAEVSALMRALFREGDTVNVYVGPETHYPPKPGKGGKCDPKGQGYPFEATNLMKPNYCGQVVAHNDPKAGAWFRPNPVDWDAYERDHNTIGEDGKPLANAPRDTHVTRFTHAVVEADEGAKEGQLAAIMRLHLPWAAIIDSGNKSIHAIVRVGAGSLDEFHERFDVLRAVCADNGLNIDKSCRNPSRLSRLPGVERENGGRQTLLATNERPQEWADWLAWVEAHRKDEPAAIASTLRVQNVYDFTGEGTPEEPPQLIAGLMYVGGKAIVTGPPKSHKSMTAIHLALELATGGEWWGHRCRRSKVLYLNTELAPTEFYRRVEVTRTNLGIDCKSYRDTLMAACTIGQTVDGSPVNYGNVCDWLEAAYAPGAYEVLVIDPIYKLETADEDHVSVNELLNRLDHHRFKMNCSIVYVHHTAKGGAAGKSVYEQGRGSGDWGGDADLMVAITELGQLRDGTPAWERALALGIGNPANSAYQIEFGTRSFNDPPHVRCFKAWPLFVPDEGGELADLRQRGDPSAKGGEATGGKARDERDRINAGIRQAIETCKGMGEKPTREKVYEALSIEGKDRPELKTLRDWTNKQDGRSCFRARQDEDGEWVLAECRQARDGRAAYIDGRPDFLSDEEQPNPEE